MDRPVRRGEIVPLGLQQRVAALVQPAPKGWLQRGLMRNAARLAEVLALPPACRYAQWVECFSPGTRQSLYTDAFKAATEGRDPEALFGDALA